MGIPGQNLLRMASRLIQFQTLLWSAWTGSTDTPAGDTVPTYADAVAIQGSIQPVPRTLYEAMGLDLQKDYYNVYTSQPLRDLTRDGACDILDFNGSRYNVESNNNWWPDGWRGSLCVRIGPTP